MLDQGLSPEVQGLTARRLARRTVLNLRKSLSWAWLDTACHYRRSKIGPIWETINALVMIVGISLVSSAVIGGTMIDLLGYVGLGMITWTAISAMIVEGASTFVRNAPNILGSNISIDMYVGRTVFKVFINLLHHSLLYLLGLVLMLVPLTWTSLLAIPGLALLLINSYWVVVFLGLVCARFRDVELIVRSLLQLAFFVTPVFWRPEQIAADRKFIVDYNVLYYSIELVRKPLLGEVPPISHYVIVVGLAAAGYAITYFVYRRLRRRLAFFI
jgi:ABC-type polysaccharide/polyol phosphate export permease